VDLGERASDTQPGWEHFPHGADVGVRGRGRTASEAFEQAALALTAIAVEPASVASAQAVEIALDAPSLDDLLLEWLNAIVLEMGARQRVFGAFTVEIAGTRLHATARGETIDLDRHDLRVEPKGATYTELAVARSDGGIWQAQCVVDV
jgi:SHS2 domain-containing protein